MADTAAHLVDKVFPRAPVRQWVLSVPRPIRYLLARDHKLLSGVLKVFVGEVFRDLRRRGRERFKGKGQPGAVTGVQRFGGWLNTNIHFHTLALDGLYVEDPAAGALRFRRLPGPTRDDLDRVLSRVRRRALKYLAKKGYSVDRAEEGGGEESGEGPSLMEAIQAASIRGWVGLAERARRVEVVGREIEEWSPPPESEVSVQSGDGWSLQAGVRIRGGDREGLERLCRYILRPPFAEERLRRLEDGRIQYEFRRARVDGATHAVFEPVEFLEKLAALVPPPRSHLLRYQGVLAPHAKERKGVVPPEGPEECHRRDIAVSEEGRPRRRGRGRRERSRWADLLKRSMGLDVLVCPRCSGRMKVIATIEEPEVVRKILRAMGLPWEAPRAEPARPPPQLEFDFDQGSMQETA